MNEREDSQTPQGGAGPGDAAAPPRRQAVRFRLERLGRLVRKELSEILRDRRTILTLVLMPLLLYPLLSLAFRQFLPEALAARLPGKEGGPTAVGYKIAIPEDRALRAATVVAAAARAGPFLAGGILPDWHGPVAILELLRGPADDARRRPPHLEVFQALDLEKAVRNGSVHLGIRREDLRPGRRGGWEAVYHPDSLRALEVLAYVERRIAAANEGALRQQLQVTRGRVQFLLKELGQWPPSEARPQQRLRLVRLRSAPLAEEREDGRRPLRAIIPLILILMTITGAVYPAIDLTAGERERGTLEILVAAPVPRMALLFAKYVSVVTVAVLTALVNLAMMTATLQLSGLGEWLFEGGGLTVAVVLQLLALLLLFGAFFSAVLLALTSFARSFKEAQAYLIPLMLVSLAPGLLGMMPGLKLEGPYAITPLLNIVLLARDLLDPAASLELRTAAVVVFSTLVYALAAIAVAARVFGAEAVLYSEQSSWSDLFRRPSRPRPAPTPAGAMLCLALIFPAYFVLASLLARAGTGEREALQVVATLLLFVGIPALAAARARVEPVSGFRLHRAPWVAFPAAALLGVSLFPLVYDLLAFLQERGLTFVGAQQKQLVRDEIARWRELPAMLVAGTAALTGALEEPFFRGYLFGALRSVGSAATAVVGSAVLFGLFHFVSAFDRLLPSTLMGLALGWVAWRTGSVLPGMLLHACYNALWTLLAYYQVGGAENAYLPPEWLGASAVGVAAGAALLAYRGRKAEGERRV